MNKSFFYTFLFLINISLLFAQDIDLNPEFSKDEFQSGVRAFHQARYESAYVNFAKAISFDESNNKARYYLGESYRKAGYEKNALFEWNALLLKGSDSRELKNKISLLYNSRGKIDQIFLSRGYLLRDNILGYRSENETPLFIKPTQIAIDNNNYYYLSSFSNGNVVVLDANLHHIKTYISDITGLKKPFGVAINSKGQLFVSDYEQNIVVQLDEFGFVKNKIGYKGLGAGGLLGPKNLAVDDEDSIYVCDSANKRINKYNSQGQFLFDFGKSISSFGGLEAPCGVFYENGKIFICDRDNNCVFIFDKSGNFIKKLETEGLTKPVDIVRDTFGRLLILAETTLWAFEEDSGLWYVVDAIGNRLGKGLCLLADKDRNILISDFNKSSFYILSLEYTRYTNLHVNVERVFSETYPQVHLAVKVMNNDLSIPVGLDNTNFNVYENGNHVGRISSLNTAKRDEIDDVVILFDCKQNMKKYINDFSKILDYWLQNKKGTTNVALMSLNEDDVSVVCDFASGRLSVLDAATKFNYSSWTDVGFGLKNAAYYMLSRFSHKSVILVTDGDETQNNFNKFKTDDVSALYSNNDISLNVVSFKNGKISDIYSYISDKTDGLYYDAYNRSDLKDLISKIEQTKGKEIILSYNSNAISRFNEEPINIFVEVSYNGTNGTTSAIYFPPKY